MECVIVGSGGCVALPRPLCACPVCSQARRLGPPYSRFGCSLFVTGANLLIDTPEDIVAAVNHSPIRGIDAIAYSHWDPDHTLGLRIIEQLRMDWLARSTGSFSPTPLRVLALDGVRRDLEAIQNPYGSFFGYYGAEGLARLETVQSPLAFGPLTVTLVPVDEARRVTIFVLEQAGRRLIYAPCDVKPFPESPLFEGADVLILGNTMIGPVLKGGFVPAPDNPLLRELFSLDEAIALRERHRIGRLILTHLEEDWGKSFDDYEMLAKHLPGVEFAYDGMRIAL